MDRDGTSAHRDLVACNNAMHSKDMHADNFEPTINGTCDERYTSEVYGNMLDMVSTDTKFHCIGMFDDIIERFACVIFILLPFQECDFTCFFTTYCLFATSLESFLNHLCYITITAAIFRS